MKQTMMWAVTALLLAPLGAPGRSMAAAPETREGKADEMPACCRMMMGGEKPEGQQGGMGMKGMKGMKGMMEMMHNCPCMKMMMKGGMMDMPGMDGMRGMPGMKGGTSTMGAQGLSRRVGDLTVRLQTSPSPPRAGNTRFTATVKTASGAPVANANLSLGLSMPSMSMGGPTIPLRHQGGGVYVGTAKLSMAGPWQADVSLRRSGKAPVRTQFAFNAR